MSEPFGDEWKREMMQFPKEKMLDFITENVILRVTRERDVFRRAVTHYADRKNWHDLDKDAGDTDIVYCGKCPPYDYAAGYDIAEAALREAEGES